MRDVKVRLTAFFSILVCLAVNHSALADENDRYNNFLKDPGMRQQMINAAAQSTVIVQNPCASAQYSVATTPVVVKPMVFDGEGHPSSGMLKFPVKEEGCGVTRLLNALIWVQGPGKAGTAAIAPGTTIADPILQKDTATRAFGAAVIAAPPDASCNIKYLADTEFVDREKAVEGSGVPPSWRENWTIVLCNKKVVVPVKFTPDSTGTAIRAGGPDMKVSDLVSRP